MVNEADVKAAILDSASENSTLLVKLSSTSEAPGLLAGHEKHLAALTDAFSEHTGILEKLREDAASKFKRHKKFRDSTTRRFICRATNMLAKFDAKAMKEERDYFDLLNTQSKAEKRRLVLQQAYDEAVKARKPLETAVKVHAETHARIDGLYEKLFAGPTPGFPTEDRRENNFYIARGKNEATKEAIRAARRARIILAASQVHIKGAQYSLRNADQQAVDSVFFLDDALILMRRGNENVSKAIKSTSHIEEHLAPPFLKLVAVKVEVDAHLKASKILVDLTSNRDKIVSTVSSALANLSKAEKALEKLAVLLKQKEEDSLEHIRETARQVEDSRQELEQFRKGIFEEVAGFGEAAPAYTECCDRMEGFCEVPEEAQGKDDHDVEDDTPTPEGDAPIVQVNSNTPAPSAPVDYENGEGTSQLSVEIPTRRKSD